MPGVTRLFAGDGIGNSFDQSLSGLVVEIFVGPFWRISATSSPAKCPLLTWNEFLDEFLPKLHCKILKSALCLRKIFVSFRSKSNRLSPQNKCRRLLSFVSRRTSKSSRPSVGRLLETCLFPALGQTPDCSSGPGPFLVTATTMW